MTTSDLTASINLAGDALKGARKVAVLTGAGVSAESGVPTFRASDGLWEGHRIEEVATPTGFKINPSLVWQFYNARRANVYKVHPNPAHHALAALERHFDGRFTLITQNVDGLHQRAGNKTVLELHGSLHRTRCTECGQIAPTGTEPLGDMPKCAECAALLRPDIVWFHEMLPGDIWRAAVKAASDCDVFLVVGTSAVVYPAAGLISMAKERSRPNGQATTVIEFNLTPTDASTLADIGLYGPAGEILPRVCERMGLALDVTKDT